MEDPSITDEGFVNFYFSTPETEFDIILCTVIAPSSSLRYPSASEIAERIKISSYETYFIKNVQSGISTFQDEEIKSYLSDTILKKLPATETDLLRFEVYTKSPGGLNQFRKDLIRKLGDSIFADSKVALCFHILTAVHLEFYHSSGIHENEVEQACIIALKMFNDYFGNYNILLAGRKLQLFDDFLFHFLELEKLPGLEKKHIVDEVTSDLARRTAQIAEYEKSKYIQNFRNEHMIAKTHEEKILHDFYLRNVNEQQNIIKYFLYGLNDRVIAKCKMKYRLNSFEFLEWYHDRPYKSSIPGSDEYFNDKLIDKSGHRMDKIPLKEALELQKIYSTNKKEFYNKLQSFEPIDQVFQEIAYYVKLFANRQNFSSKSI